MGAATNAVQSDVGCQGREPCRAPRGEQFSCVGLVLCVYDIVGLAPCVAVSMQRCKLDFCVCLCLRVCEMRGFCVCLCEFVCVK